MKISLNNLLNESICSYRWPLDLVETIDYYLEDDLDNITKGGKVKIKTDWKTSTVKEDNISIDWEYLDNYIDLQMQYLTSYFNEEKLRDALKKYWIIMKWFSIWKPKFYNFEQDSLDLEFEIEWGDWRKKYPELTPYVQEYIDTIRRPSRDGYASFEPTKVEDVDMDDSTYIRAILKKENLLGELQQDLKYWIEDCIENPMEFVWTISYKYKWRNYCIDDDKLLAY